VINVNGDNSVEEEIKERIILGEKAYYANRKSFKSNLISKKAKL
jgi:hypothetical protein